MKPTFRRFRLFFLALCLAAGVPWAAGGSFPAQAAGPDAPMGEEAAVAAGDPEAGRSVFRKCQACHSLEPGKNRLGPTLHGIFGRRAGSLEDYNYSEANKSSDTVWTMETLNTYLRKPRAYMPGTKMAFVGLPRAQDRADLLAFLKDATR